MTKAERSCMNSYLLVHFLDNLFSWISISFCMSCAAILIKRSSAWSSPESLISPFTTVVTPLSYSQLYILLSCGLWAKVFDIVSAGDLPSIDIWFHLESRWATDLLFLMMMLSFLLALILSTGWILGVPDMPGRHHNFSGECSRKVTSLWSIHRSLSRLLLNSSFDTFFDRVACCLKLILE